MARNPNANPQEIATLIVQQKRALRQAEAEERSAFTAWTSAQSRRNAIAEELRLIESDFETKTSQESET